MNQRLIAFATIGAASVLLLVGCFLPMWLIGTSAFGVEIKIGLRTLEICSDGHCRDGALGTFGVGDLHQVKTLGLVCFGLGIASTIALVGSATLAYFERARDWFMAPTTIAILLSALTLIIGVVALVTFRGRVSNLNVGTGIGFILYGLGATAGLTGAILVGRFPHPDEDLFEPPFEAI